MDRTGGEPFLSTRQAMRLCPREWRRGRLLEQVTRRLNPSGEGQGGRKRLAKHLRHTCAAAAALRAELTELSPQPVVCGEHPLTAIPKHPQPTAANRRREAALREALLAGAVPHRPRRTVALPSVPWNSAPNPAPPGTDA